MPILQSANICRHHINSLYLTQGQFALTMVDVACICDISHNLNIYIYIYIDILKIGLEL